jgi:hypothetical protein
MIPSGVSQAVVRCAVALFALTVLLFAAPPAASGQTLQSCGNEGESPCGGLFGGADACDTGLGVQTRTCGCVLRGFFGNCIIPGICRSCENRTRRRPSINAFASSWANWALKNQRELAQDEPINWVTHIGSHNSFNTQSDGHFLNGPNHFYSMSDALRAGARLLTLDLHFLPEGEGPARVCHGGDVRLLAFLGIEPLAGPGALCNIPGNPGIDGNPGMRYYANGIKEIRNWLRDNPNEIVIIGLEDYVFDQGGTSAAVRDPLTTYFGSMLFNPPLQTRPGFDRARWPTRRELLANGGPRVIVFDDGGAPGLFSQSTALGTFNDGWFAENLATYPACDTSNVVSGGEPSNSFSIVVEDRAAYTLIPSFDIGELDASDVTRAVDCNKSLIAMDFFSSSLPGGRAFDVPDFSRQEAAVWSWNSGDRGQNGDCALLQNSSGRWVSANCDLQRRFACALPRSESGLDPLEFPDPLGENWAITTAAGRWEDGHAACQTEFPGRVFGVPVNGYQNRKLKAANTSGADLWLNYTDRDVEGRWTIGPAPESGNAPPIAEAGPDQALTCGARAKLDATASADPDGDPLTYTWTGPFGTLTGPAVRVTLPLGTHAILLTVSDGKGGTDTDSLTVTLTDTKAPRLAVTFSPAQLWPADDRMVPVVANITAADACDGEAPAVELVSLTSNEPQGWIEGGSPAPDIEGAETGTDDREFQLRAEIDRVYKATYRATDLSGNVTEGSIKIRVAPPPEP